MEYRSVGVLREVRNTPRVRGVGDAEGAEHICDLRPIRSIPTPDAPVSTARSGRGVLLIGTWG
jgi:hypothetical protein